MGGLFVSNTFSQNIAPNPSFETFTSCPFNVNGGQPLEATPWNNPTPGTSDYYNQCDNPGPVGVPQNGFGYQPARTGQAYCGFYTHTTNGNYREYLQAPLNSPMIAGITYHVSFFVSLADIYCGTYNIGAYFSVSPPPFIGTNQINAIPQIQSTLGYISDATNWTLITGCFVAQGGESFITIGNFYPIASTPIDPNCSASQSYSYYYIDDVEVIPGDPAETLPIDLGGPVSNCDEFEIDPAIDDVAFLWENGTQQSTLIVSETGTYTVTITDGCNIGIDSLDVTILGSPDPIDVGPDDVTICPGDEYEIELNPQWEYHWNDGSQASDYLISTEGNYRVTMNDGCDESIDNITVHIMEPPQSFTLGTDTRLCPGEEIYYDFDPDLGSFQWQDNTNSPSYTIDHGGTYTLYIYNMCGIQSDEIEVTAIPEPSVNLGTNQLFMCEGSTIPFDLDPNVGSYVWQDGLVTPSYTISQPGQYSVTVSNECGSSSDEVTVTVIPRPQLELGNDSTLCPFQFPFNMDLSGIPNTTGFLWQDGSTLSSYTVSNAGSYSVTISNSCFSISDSISIHVADDSPDVTLPDNLLLCPGQTTTLYNVGAPGQYLWQDGSTADTLLVSEPGLYTLTLSNGCGFGMDSVTVAYQQPVSIPNLGPDFSLCSGDEVVLYSNVPGVQYLWQDLSTKDSLIAIGPGTYYVQVSDLCSTATDTIQITESNMPPEVDIPSQIRLCQGESLVIDVSLPGVSFLWNDGNQQPLYTISSPGTYSVTASNTCGANSDTLIVTDGGPSPFVQLGEDVSLCPGDMIVLTPEFSNVTNWSWSNGSSDSTYTITGNELVVVEVRNACGLTHDTLHAVLLAEIPPLHLGADTALCPGQSFVINIPVNDVNILWSDGSTDANLIIGGEGVFSASISNTCGSSTDTIQVFSLPEAPTLELGNDQSLCPGETITIEPGVENVNYVWQDGSVSTSYQATGEGTIILTLSNVCGSAIDSLTIRESTEGPQLNLGPDLKGCEGDLITLFAGISGVDYLWQDGSTAAALTTTASGTFILQVANNCGADVDTIEVILGSPPSSFNLGSDTLLCPGQSLLLIAPQTHDETEWQDGSHASSLVADKSQTYSLQISNACGVAYDEITLTYDNRVPVVKLDSIIALCPGDEITLDASQSFPVSYAWSTGSDLPVIRVTEPGHYDISILSFCSNATAGTQVVPGDSCFSANSIFIPNIFSPNGDNVNDAFVIEMSKSIVVHALHISIFDRWGNMVFFADHIPVVWRGDFEGAPLDQGVYVYKVAMEYFDTVAERNVIFNGDVTLIR